MKSFHICARLYRSALMTSSMQRKRSSFKPSQRRGSISQQTSPERRWRCHQKICLFSKALAVPATTAVASHAEEVANKPLVRPGSSQWTRSDSGRCFHLTDNQLGALQPFIVAGHNMPTFELGVWGARCTHAHGPRAAGAQTLADLSGSRSASLEIGRPTVLHRHAQALHHVHLCAIGAVVLAELSSAPLARLGSRRGRVEGRGRAKAKRDHHCHMIR